jgi:hypothetical protein
VASYRSGDSDNNNDNQIREVALFLDQKAHGEPWDGRRLCRSCKTPIDPAEPAAELHFDGDFEQRLEELNGAYHARCAAPLLSIKRALDALGRLPFA